MKKTVWMIGVFFLLLAGTFYAGPAAAQVFPVVNASVSGEIQRLIINDPTGTDHWAGGVIVVSGTVVIIPRNLLMDLPANRMTLREFFDQAPAACLATGESGLAKGDICNTTGMAGFATVSVNRMPNGDVIAGDVFIEKGREGTFPGALMGNVTFINEAEGYFKINGDDLGLTGTMVRLNDPIGRHTIQSGLGCLPGSLNCSPDPRFTLDPDNYTNVFSSGYPYCIGSGVNCPRTNRGVVTTPLIPEPPVADSSHFAPLLVGDNISVEGNYETINGVQFLSAHSSMVHKALTTQPGQPDYLFLDEVEVDAPGFQNQRARSLIIGYATAAPGGTTDIVVWTLHRDPTTNTEHEFPLASVVGCDAAGGAGTCGAQGLGGAGNNIFKIRHDVDFILAQQTGFPTKDGKLSPCAHLRNDPRFSALNICPSAGPDGRSTLAEELAILSPMPHEIIARTGLKISTPGLQAFDVQGRPAQWGEYLFPFGLNLGGVSFPEMNEINLDLLAFPNLFEGIPWNLDRRLSPGGCFGACEGTPQPLDPFPFSGLDPRTQASLPANPYNDPNYTASQLSDVRNRMLSYVDAGAGNFNGDATVLTLPAAGPPKQTVPPAALVPVLLTCTQGVVGVPPVAGDDAASAAGVLVAIPVTANDSATLPAILDPATVVIIRPALNGTAAPDLAIPGTVNYTPNPGFVGVDSFTYTVKDNSVPPLESNVATVVVTVTAPVGNVPPVAVNDTTGTAGVLAAITVVTNDTATLPAAIDPASVLIQTAPLNGTATFIGGGVVNYLPNPGFVGADSFTYTVKDTNVPPGESNVATVTITVSAATGNIPPVAVNDIATAPGSAVAIAVTGNDTDADGTVVAGSMTIQTAPINGTTQVNVPIPGTVTYTPNAGYVGADSFTYIVLDNIGAQSNVATVIVSVTPSPNTAPVAGNDLATTTINAPVVVNVVQNDSDADGTINPATVTIASPPAHGTILISTTGTVTYTPALNYVGADSFAYTVQDNRGAASNAATVSLDVTGLATNELINLTRVEFRQANSQWIIRGTSSVPGPGNSVTFRVGPNFTGATIGSDAVGAGGAIRFTLRRAIAVPDATSMISVQSSNGTLLLNVPVTIVP